MAVKLRPYQRDCLTAFYRYYDSGGKGHTLIVLPTAAGKSIVIGALISEICQRWPDQRILVLSHVAELIKQNHEKIMMCWPNAPAGIYSAGLGKRQAHFPICVASVQSVYKRSRALGHRDIVLIDEVHLLQPGNLGMYGELIKGLQEINPNLIICGATATDYRTDSGLLTQGEDPLFTDVIIEISILKLLEEGYLTPPISKQSVVQADMKGVAVTAGEFNIKQMAARFDQKEFLNKALDNDMPLFEGRNSIAIFCATLENANHVAAGLCVRGIETEVIDGEMPRHEREDKLRRFRSGELRGLASVGVITTGTDIPNIDCIVFFRATKSPGLYQQIIGRGFRVVYADGYDLETREGRLAAIANGPKPNFLVIDHGENITRHGPITHVQKPLAKVKGQKSKLEKPKARICEICRTANTLEALTCIVCGSELVAQRDPTASLSLTASDADILGTPFSRGEVAQWFDVDDVRYSRHSKAGSPDSFRVTYYCGIMLFDEWRSLKFIKQWWEDRSGKPVPVTIMDALAWAETLRKPRRIMVYKKGKNYNIVKYEFEMERIAL